MATKEQVIPVTPPTHMQLTPTEAGTLRERFKADLAHVVTARAGSGNGPSVTNIRGQGGKKTSKKKTAGKPAKKKAGKTSKKKTSKKK